MELYKYTGSVAALTVRFGKAETITLNPAARRWVAGFSAGATRASQRRSKGGFV